MAINPKWGGSTTVGTKPSSGKATISIQGQIPSKVKSEDYSGWLFPGITASTGQGRMMGKRTSASTGGVSGSLFTRGRPNLYNWTGSRTGGYRNLKSKFRLGGRRATGGTGFAPGRRIASALRGE